MKINNFNLENLLKKYYLNDDELEYLHFNYKKIFIINDIEECICLKNLKFKDCCKKKVLSSPHKRNEYISFFQLISDINLKEKYLEQENFYYNFVIEKLKKNKCILKKCQNIVIESFLYFDDNKKEEIIEIEKYYYINKFENKHYFKNINFSFLNLIKTNNFYYYYMLCKNHYNEFFLIKEYNLNFALKSLLINMYENLVDYNCFYIKYLNFYNLLNITEQVILTIKLRKFIKLNKIFESELYLLLNDLDNENKNYFLKEFILNNNKKNNNFIINDVFFPSITPISLQTINSLNNLFLSNKILFINNIKNIDNNKICINFYFHKNNKIINLFFEEWLKKITNEKELENFLSSFIINQTNHILIDKNYYQKLNDYNRNLLNIYFYNRYEQPKNFGEETMLKLFINNFHNGINIF